MIYLGSRNIDRFTDELKSLIEVAKSFDEIACT